MTTENSVVVYQNGIAAFERTFDVTGQGKRLSLPFKTEHVGDVVGSLTILGDVELVEQPNYAPEKQEPNLKINPAQTTKDLGNALRGADIKVTLTGTKAEVLKGKVMGMETEKIAIFSGGGGGGVTGRLMMTLLKDDGNICRLDMTEQVASFEFVDEKIKEEINKALAYSLEQIKPGSTFVYMTLKSRKATKAKVRYAVPTPAWKFSYRARQTKDGWVLHGFAVVDNNTDEDWRDFRLAVATGQPVTFSTDLAEIRIPKRNKVNLVNDKAQGAVEVESGFVAESLEGNIPTRSRAYPAPQAACFSAPKGGAAPQADEDMWAPLRSSEVTVMEASDSSVFTAEQPVTVQAHKSALVPIFTLRLKDSELVLYYNRTKNPTQPMRAVRLTNEATHSLGRGACTVEQEGVYVGSAVLTACKPGESAMLCHAAETGVKVLHEQGRCKTRISSVELAKGVLVTEMSNQQPTTYKFNNMRDEAFTVILDHTRVMDKSTIVCEGCVFVESLKDGVERYKLISGKRNTATCTITETKIDKQRIEANGVLKWFQENGDSPLLKQDGLQKVVGYQKELDNCNNEITLAKAKVETLVKEQGRLRENLAAVKGTDNKEWTARLVECEKEISTQEKSELPKLEKQKKELTEQLRAECARLSAKWTA